jgi:hypothetical protein
MISGTDQISKKMTHGIKNDPPPFWATILENRQILPVPTAMPMTDRIIPHRDVNNSFVSGIDPVLSVGRLVATF